MKAADVRAMTVDQLDDEVLKLKKEQFNLRFQRATGQLENTSRVREVRRDIARMKTIARQKRTGDEPTVKAPAAKAESRARQGQADGQAPCAREIQIEAEPEVAGQGRRSRRSKRIVCRSERCRAWW